MKSHNSDYTGLLLIYDTDRENLSFQVRLKSVCLVFSRIKKKTKNPNWWFKLRKVSFVSAAVLLLRARERRSVQSAAKGQNISSGRLWDVKVGSKQKETIVLWTVLESQPAPIDQKVTQRWAQLLLFFFSSLSFYILQNCNRYSNLRPGCSQPRGGERLQGASELCVF